MKKAYFTLAVLMTFGVACGSATVTPSTSLIQKQPYVLKSLPEKDSILQGTAKIQLTFSQKILFEHLHPLSVAIIKGTIPKEAMEDCQELMDQLEDEELSMVPIEYQLESEGNILTIFPLNELEEGWYHIIVTPKLFSSDNLPFNQEPGKTPKAFIQKFGYGDPTSPRLSNPLPDMTSEEESTFYEYGPVANFLILNEILYDGKTSETDGEAFVELYGSPGADISDYEIIFLNGADGSVTDRVKIPKGSFLPEDGIYVIADLKTNSSTESNVLEWDLLDQFDPQNGPDGIHLIDREGKILDRIIYGEGAVENTEEGELFHEGDPAVDVGGGKSLSRIEGVDTDNNFLDFIELLEPTPGVL